MGRDLALVSDYLIDEALKRNSQDNITVMITKLTINEPGIDSPLIVTE